MVSGAMPRRRNTPAQVHLTAERIDVLASASRRPWSTEADLRMPARRLSSLVTAGFLRSVGNSEQVRGEPRFHWREYTLTARGYAVVPAEKRGSHYEGAYHSDSSDK